MGKNAQSVEKGKKRTLRVQRKEKGHSECSEDKIELLECSEREKKDIHYREREKSTRYRDKDKRTLTA